MNLPAKVHCISAKGVEVVWLGTETPTQLALYGTRLLPANVQFVVLLTESIRISIEMVDTHFTYLEMRQTSLHVYVDPPPI